MTATTTPLLSALPGEHPLRNAPLLAIGAQNRWPGSPPGKKGWVTVGKKWRIATCTFNDLGPAWTAHLEWRASSNPGAGAAPSVGN